MVQHGAAWCSYVLWSPDGAGTEKIGRSHQEGSAKMVDASMAVEAVGCTLPNGPGANFAMMPKACCGSWVWGAQSLSFWHFLSVAPPGTLSDALRWLCLGC